MIEPLKFRNEMEAQQRATTAEEPTTSTLFCLVDFKKLKKCRTVMTRLALINYDAFIVPERRGGTVYISCLVYHFLYIICPKVKRKTWASDEFLTSLMKNHFSVLECRGCKNSCTVNNTVS